MLLWATTVIHISEQICYISKWKYYSFSYNNVYYGNKLLIIRLQNDQHDCDYIIFRYMQAHCILPIIVYYSQLLPSPLPVMRTLYTYLHVSCAHTHII